MKKVLKREETFAIVNVGERRERRQGLKGRPGAKAVMAGSQKNVSNAAQSAFGGSRGELEKSQEAHAEHHLVIQTMQEGFNMGRRYVHRVPEGEVAHWVSDLRELTKDAKARSEAEAMQAFSEQNPVESYRERVRRFYAYEYAPPRRLDARPLRPC